MSECVPGCPCGQNPEDKQKLLMVEEQEFRMQMCGPKKERALKLKRKETIGQMMIRLSQGKP